jgi:hypothetical protein
MHGHHTPAAVYLQYRNTHFNAQQQSCAPREQSHDEKQPAERFQHTGDIDQLRGQAVLRKRSLESTGVARELRVAVCQEDHAEGHAENAQAQRLQRVQELHGILLSKQVNFRDAANAF